MAKAKKVLFVCGGNTCRSPMAKVILARILRDSEVRGDVVIDSAACDGPTMPNASEDARTAMQQLFGEDLLADHVSKGLDTQSVESADIILVMAQRMKNRLPADKTWTLREYAGQRGDILDPWRKGIVSYAECAGEIQRCLQRSIPRLIADLGLESQ